MTFKLLQELKEPSVIWEQDPEDPNNPEVLVKGVGRYKLKQLEKNVHSKIEDLYHHSTEREGSFQDWKTIGWMLNHGAMLEMVKTIVAAKKEIEGVKESINEMHGGPHDISIDGYTLRQEEEYEDDNMKIWHFAQAPGEKEVVLQHTPYEYLDEDDFLQYVQYHKKYGEWPNRRPMRGGTANWDRDSVRHMNRRLGPRYIDKARNLLKDKV